ncbi:MAG: calcineurin-like phosphoesterase C-terminal domain-containing protein, partial [Bryobacteraceae bacterium]|nr:calcineurin-like phosphoesterase C-terminal domain-containing protein [Bryobacteraceae bacterium]
SGHMHTSEHHYLPAPGGLHHHQIITALSGSWWSGPFDATGRPLSVSSDGTPHGWHELTIDGADYHTTFVPAREDAIARAIVPDLATRGAAPAAIETVSARTDRDRLLVNVFDGGPRTRVYVEAGGERHILRRIHETDPHTEHLYREAGPTLKYWVQAEASSHLWALDVSALPAEAVHDARLTIVDEFGRVRLEKARLLLS